MQETTLFRLLFVVYLAVSVAIGLGTQLTTWRQADPLRLDLHCIFGAVYFQHFAIFLCFEESLEAMYRFYMRKMSHNYDRQLKRLMSFLTLFPILSTLGQTAVLILWAINTSKEDFKRYLPGFILICIYTLINLIWFIFLMMPAYAEMELTLETQKKQESAKNVARHVILEPNSQESLDRLYNLIAQFHFVSTPFVNQAIFLAVRADCEHTVDKKYLNVMRGFEGSECALCADSFQEKDTYIKPKWSRNVWHSICYKSSILAESQISAATREIVRASKLFWGRQPDELI